MFAASSLRCLLPLLVLPAPALPEPVLPDCRAGAPTFCLLSDPDAPRALVALTLPVGAADEGPGEHGIAHYLEHLTFRDRDVEAEEMASAGAGIDRFGNAHTGSWATTYHWTVPPDRAAEAVGRAMAVLSSLEVVADAAAQERAIVAREREQRKDSPAARDGLAMDAALYAETPLARSVIGTARDIDALTLQAARAFHDRHYDPATAIVVVAGDVHWSDVGDLAGRGKAMPRRIPDLHLLPADPHRMTRRDAVQRPERWQVSLFDLTTGQDTRAALSVADAYLASSLPNAPAPALVRGRDDTLDAWAEIHEVVPGLGALAVGVVLRPGREPADLDAPWAAWNVLREDLIRSGLDAATVTRLKDRMVRDEAHDREDGIAAAWSLIGAIEAGDDVADWVAWPDRLAAVEAPDVAEIFAALADSRRIVTLDTLPRGTPAAPEVQTQ